MVASEEHNSVAAPQIGVGQIAEAASAPVVEGLALE